MTIARAIDLGRMSYAAAYAEQLRHVDEMLAARDAGRPEVGRLLLVEHDPVITVSRRQGAAAHVLATPELLARHGVALEETDRGGDVTYHGPGQLVCYPILDLNLLNLGLHAYMRLLEHAVIDTVADFGITAQRDSAATGVWVSTGDQSAKLAAMGVRVRKWVSMHGLAINVTTNLDHFALIVPCGLVGRPVTSLERLCTTDPSRQPPPTMHQVRASLTTKLDHHLEAALVAARQHRAAAQGESPKFVC